MKYLQSALGIGPLFERGEAPSEEAKTELVQAARFLLNDPSFSLPDAAAATAEELEAVQEGLAVYCFKLREIAHRLELQKKQAEVGVLLPYAKKGAKAVRRAKDAQARAVKARHETAGKTESAIVCRARSLLHAGRDRREVAGIIARNMGVTARYIRKILSKHVI